MLRSFGEILGWNREDDSGNRASRRNFLCGLGALGAAATVGAFTLPGDAAHAASSPDDMTGDMTGGASASDDGRFETAQRWRDDDRRWRRDGRRERRERRGGRRMSRRELRRMCRNDRSFRRRNRGLCAQVAGRGRRGSCVTIGPFTVCD